MRRESLNSPRQAETHTDVQDLGSHTIRDGHGSIAFARYGIALHQIGNRRSESDEDHTDKSSHTGRVGLREAELDRE